MCQVDDPHHAVDHAETEAQQHQHRDAVGDVEQKQGGERHGGSQVFTSMTNCLLSFGSLIKSHTAAVSAGAWSG